MNNIPSAQEFQDAILSRGFALNPTQVNQAARFAYILHRENQNQNLTRILGVQDFIDGHLIDVIELLSIKTLGNRVLDIGSGSGVPGLLAAAIDLNPNRVWFLTDSEIMKAEYLKAASIELGLERVSVFSERVEDVIEITKPDTVIARAVGTVEKIAGWIWKCSTWNNLVLFKSRGWDQEWSESRIARFGKKLTVTHTHDYSNSERTRLLISLSKK